MKNKNVASAFLKLSELRANNPALFMQILPSILPKALLCGLGMKVSQIIELERRFSFLNSLAGDAINDLVSRNLDDVEKAINRHEELDSKKVAIGGMLFFAGDFLLKKIRGDSSGRAV